MQTRSLASGNRSQASANRERGGVNCETLRSVSLLRDADDARAGEAVVQELTLRIEAAGGGP